MNKKKIKMKIKMIIYYCNYLDSRMKMKKVMTLAKVKLTLRIKTIVNSFLIVSC